MASLIIESLTQPLTVIHQSAIAVAALNVNILSESKIEVFSLNRKIIDDWIKSVDLSNYSRTYNLLQFKTYSQRNKAYKQVNPKLLNPPWFTIPQITNIYNFPSPTEAKVVVGIISFGGGLYGSVNQAGVLTNGDVQAYWSHLGIQSDNFPKVIIVPIDGAKNKPNINDGSSTYENTISVETVGACCPSSNLTIILYLASNTLSEFYNVYNYAINTPVVVNDVSYKPTIISCSWGTPEIYFPSSELTNINTMLLAATGKGVNLCAASGDSNEVNFPSCIPYVTAVGGTTLVCPNVVYDGLTVETVWSGSGGGISSVYPKPDYQSAITAITAVGRSTPDIVFNADPNTGILYVVNGTYYVFGGTSVSAQTYAGLLALINPSNFINTKLYSNFSSSCYHNIANAGLGSLNGQNLLTNLNSIIQVSSLSVNKTDITLPIGNESLITVTVLPIDAVNQQLTWQSNNSNISVSSSGLVTANSVGSSVITVHTTDGSNLLAMINVKAVKAVKAVQIERKQMGFLIADGYSLVKGQTVAAVADETVRNFKSLYSNIASIDSNGLITGLEKGVTIISAKLSNNKTVSITVNVTIPTSDVSLNQTSLSLNKRESFVLKATISPKNASDKICRWYSKNEQVAIVDSSGLVKGIKVGKTTITVTSSNIQSSCEITVV